MQSATTTGSTVGRERRTAPGDGSKISPGGEMCLFAARGRDGLSIAADQLNRRTTLTEDGFPTRRTRGSLDSRLTR
jgi:hypothetical protein